MVSIEATKVSQLPDSVTRLTLSPTTRTVKTDDIIALIHLDDLVLSPNGSQAIFSRSDLDETGERREDTLWLLDIEAKTAQRLLGNEEDEDASHLVWSPAGGTIGILLAKDGPPQLHLVSTSGAKSLTLTSLPDGVEDFLWSPDGRQIALLSVTSEDDTLPDGVTISTRADFRSGDEPFKSSSIWIVNSTGKDALKQLMSTDTSITLSFWASDGQALYYTVDEAIEPYYGGATSSLVSISATDGSQLTTMPLTVTGKSESLKSAPTFVPSPDGTRIAFSIGSPEAPSGFAQDEIFVMDLGNGATDMDTDKYDREIGDDGFEWLDDNRLIAINSDQGNANLVEIDVRNHTVTPWWAGQRVVSSFAYARQGKRLLAIASDFTTPEEIYDISVPEHATVITSINKNLSDDIMAGADYLIARPYVDDTKLGISGASAGGVLTDWAITHTDRFGAAVSVSDIADLLAYWFLGDQPDMEDATKQPWLTPRTRNSCPSRTAIKPRRRHCS